MKYFWITKTALSSAIFYYFIIWIQIVMCVAEAQANLLSESECTNLDQINTDKLWVLSKLIVPCLEGKKKGDAGKIGVIGGSTEYSGAPFFAAMSSLRIGADLVYVITTESAAPIIKSYSPDLIVYPFLNINYLTKINNLITKMDAVIIGPGLGREDETMKLTYEIIETCKNLRKPLIVDADGLYAISKNLSIMRNYPKPGAILTPNHKEAKRLEQSISSNMTAWYSFWDDYVTILVKGQEDRYYNSRYSSLTWFLSEGGSGRRAGGQGDILSGALATFLNWALKSNFCSNVEESVKVSHSVAAFAAAKFTRACNAKSYALYGRSMTASDMLHEIHSSFDSLFL